MRQTTIDSIGFLTFITNEHWRMSVLKAKRIRRYSKVKDLLKKIRGY